MNYGFQKSRGIHEQHFLYHDVCLGREDILSTLNPKQTGDMIMSICNNNLMEL